MNNPKLFWKLNYTNTNLRKMLDQKKLPQISWNKLTQLNKLIRHKETNSYKEINQTNQLTKDPRAQMVNWCGVVSVLPWGQGFESHNPHLFAKYLIFHVFFLQSIKTTKTSKFCKKHLIDKLKTSLCQDQIATVCLFLNSSEFLWIGSQQIPK